MARSHKTRTSVDSPRKRESVIGIDGQQISRNMRSVLPFRPGYLNVHCLSTDAYLQEITLVSALPSARSVFAFRPRTNNLASSCAVDCAYDVGVDWSAGLFNVPKCAHMF